MKKVRCAIYTRKSSEEGLDQSFNSLHAQRGACEAYVLSQAGEGWSALPALYDDGGYSGGTMERPALKQLLADIGAGKVDVVVVYKVDRLTRSLTDFARIVETFDAKGVSFVSVTQAFNTTTSMGRLTLNVLLSFAQFEREVTGERIRDKIAASKAKGMWMGGRPPLGYDAVDQKLVVNGAEAELVRSLFRRYLELGSVVKLIQALETEQVRSKTWITRDGRRVDGAPFTRGSLGYLLKNPVYRGAIRHKTQLHWNAHPAIVDEDLWNEVQARLTAQAPEDSNIPKGSSGALLKGRIFDDVGGAMQPIHANRRGRRYHYYVSSARVHGDGRPVGSLPRISAPVIEKVILGEIARVLRPAWQPGAAIEQRAASALKRAVLSEDAVTLDLAADACRPDTGADEVGQDVLRLRRPIRLKHRQGASIIVPHHAAAPTASRPDRTLVRALALGAGWRRQLESGQAKNVKELAQSLGQCQRHTGRILPLGYLAPDLVEMILDGRQPAAMTLQALTSAPLPLAWSDQRRLVASFG